MQSEERTAPEGGPRFRASDADRAATVDVLQDAVARGLLTHDEGSERMSAALHARFRDELPPLTDDLPPVETPAAVSPVGWRQLGSTLVAQARYELQATRAAGIRSRRFVVTLLVAALLMWLVVGIGDLAVDGLLEGEHDHHELD